MPDTKIDWAAVDQQLANPTPEEIEQNTQSLNQRFAEAEAACRSLAQLRRIPWRDWLTPFDLEIYGN